MIELNLLPEELRKKKKRIELPDIPIIPIVGVLVGLLIIFQLLIGGITLMCKNQLRALDGSWEKLAPGKMELDGIKRQIKNTGSKIEAIENLIEKRLSWTQLLNELSNSLTPNIWLKELVYQERKKSQARDSKKNISRKPPEEKVKSLLISGSASAKGQEATRDIAQFITALKSNNDFFKDFEDIELLSIKKNTVAGQDSMDFTILCEFRSGSSGG